MKKTVLVSCSFVRAALVASSPLVILTHGLDTACLRAGSDGENTSRSDFLLQYRHLLDEQKARYRDARIDGRLRSRRYSLNPSNQGSDKARGDSPPEMGLLDSDSATSARGAHLLGCLGRNTEGCWDSMMIQLQHGPEHSMSLVTHEPAVTAGHFLDQSATCNRFNKRPTAALWRRRSTGSSVAPYRASRMSALRNPRNRWLPSSTARNSLTSGPLAGLKPA